jgi:hypothetical protein
MLVLPSFLCFRSCLVWATIAVFIMLFFLHYHSFCIILLHYCSSHLHSSLSLPSHCWSSHPTTLFHVAIVFTLLFKRLLASLYCSSCITIPDPFALFLLYFVWLVWYFPYPCHVQVGHQRFHTKSNTKCEFFCIFFNIFIIVVFLFIVFDLFFVLLFFCCCYFCNFVIFFFPINFVLFLFIMYFF